jgi:hypothetical protein
VFKIQYPKVYPRSTQSIGDSFSDIIILSSVEFFSQIYSMSIDVGPFLLSELVGLLVAVKPACFSSQVLTGSSVRFKCSNPDTKPLQKAIGSLLSSFRIGVSSCNSIRSRPNRKTSSIQILTRSHSSCTSKSIDLRVPTRVEELVSLITCVRCE